MQVPSVNPITTSLPCEDLPLYERDFFAWVQQQASLLRHQQWQELDLSNLIEEIESLGRQQRQELRNRLTVLIGHLLKWNYQPSCRSRSWLATIRIQRRELLRLLKENPSLKPYLSEALLESYENGRDLAMGETNLPESIFPVSCCYELGEILDAGFYPGEPSDWVTGSGS
jgi:hypothetical protein